MKKTTRNYIWILVTNFLLLATVVGVWQFRLKAPSFEAGQGKPQAVAPAAGSVVAVSPPVKLPDAAYRANLTEPANLATLKGPALVNIWASWCGPCIIEMPTLQTLADDYKAKGLQVIAISIDDTADAAALEANITRLKFGPIARYWDDEDKVYAALNPEGLPMTYLIDAQGRITAKVMGERDWTSAESRALVDDLLKR